MFFRAALLRYRPGWWLSPDGRVVIDRLGSFSSRAYGGDRITNGGTDRSFITGIHKRPRSQNVLKAIESLSSALGMTVVVEGIETFEELAYLQAATRIRYVQGFYFSKPIFIGKGGYGDGRRAAGTHVPGGAGNDGHVRRGPGRALRQPQLIN